MKLYLTGGDFDQGADLVMCPIGGSREPFKYEDGDTLLVSFDRTHPYLATLSMVRGGRMYMIDVVEGGARDSKFQVPGTDGFVDNSCMQRFARDLGGRWVEVGHHANHWRRWQLVHD